MSRLFEQSKVSRSLEEQSNEKQFDVLDLLERIRSGNGVSAALAETRLRPCRKITLTPSQDSRVVLLWDNPAPAAVEAYRALRTRVLRAQSAGGIHSIVISSALPGEGKTLTSLNLALCCSQLQDARVLLIDADLRTRGLTQLLGGPQVPGLADLLTGHAKYEDIVLTTDRAGLHVVSAGSSSVTPLELFAGPQWAEFMGWCSEFFKLILIDSPPIMPLADFELITGSCDAVLVVVRAIQTQRDALKKAANHIDRKKLLGMVYNGAVTGELGSYHRGSYANDARPTSSVGANQPLVKEG